MYKQGAILKRLLLVGLVGAFGAYGLAAEQSTESRPQAPARQPPAAQEPVPGVPPQRPVGQAMMLHKTSELIGKTATNPQGENLGTIHDIVLTPDHRQVSYVALSAGGVFGIGRRLHAIPWQVVSVSAKGDITLPITTDQLEQAPGFSNDNWPSQGDTRWLRAGATTPDRTATSESEAQPSQPRPGTTGPAAMAGREVEMRRVTRLTGLEVKNAANEDLGDIEDFVVNAADGRVTYVIISFGGIAGIGERYAAVPANAVRIQPQTQTALLNATRQTLESVAFAAGEAPNLASSEYMQRARQLFPAVPAGTALGYLPPEPAEPADEESAWGPESRYGKSFRAEAAKTIKGTVESVGCFRPEGAKAGVPMGLRLRVRTTEGDILTVHAGPIAHAEQQNFFLMPGDEITITGCEMKIGLRSVMVASELRKGSQTLQLRDPSGRPLWSMGPRGPGQRELRQRSGTAGQRQP